MNGERCAREGLREASFTELCDHIVDWHHVLLRSELPRIKVLLAKVAGRHGSRLPALAELEQQFDGLQEELIEHIDREEQGLFPNCRALDGDAADAVQLPDPAILRMHEAKHGEVVTTLEQMRDLAGHYRIDQALCSSHRELLESMQALEGDLLQHIHEENDLLFPRLRDVAGARPSAAAP